MKTIIIVGVTAVVTGPICYIAGNWHFANRLTKKLHTLEPVLVRMVTDTIIMYSDTNMTKEDLIAQIEESLNFLKIISK